MIKYIFILATFIFVNHALGQPQNCLKYEPTIVKVVGVIEKETFPGPPNYESIDNGDKPEVYWILKLTQTVCIKDDSENEINVSESNITEMQLVLNESQYKDYHNFVGQKVSVTGTLFHAITGHHKTKVLIKVNQMIDA